MKQTEGVKALVYDCACLTAEESVLILSDTSTQSIGEVVTEVCLETTPHVTHEILPPLATHGVEPSEKIADLMFHANVVFCLTSFSLAHTQARKEANKNGSRFLSLPNYSWDVLTSPAMAANFKGQKPLCDTLSDRLTQGTQIKITSLQGTQLELDVSQRIGNSAPGICSEKGTLGSPPDIEVNIAPLENSAHGIAVIDGSVPVPELGLLDEQITLTLEEGRIVEIEDGIEADILRKILEKENNPKVYIPGELGIGLNPLSKLCGRMLEDEGALGTVHLGFGSNSTIGGENKVSFHIDMVMKDVTVFIDGKEILKEGQVCL